MLGQPSQLESLILINLSYQFSATTKVATALSTAKVNRDLKMLPQFTISKTKKLNFLRIVKTKELAAFFELICTLLSISKYIINLRLIASLHRNTT